MQQKEPVIAIIDVGKTNKKLFLFNRSYEIVFETTAKFDEIRDEDGSPCEDLNSLVRWAKAGLKEVLSLEAFEVKAVNFTTYGASFVYVDEAGDPLTPLYNYLKDFPEHLSEQFYNTYGWQPLSLATASPVLGSLNSGLQFYRLKYERPEVYAHTKYALHLPQYMSFLFTGKAYSDITSIGCHTKLLDFAQKDYHYWVKAEGLTEKLAPIFAGDACIPITRDGRRLQAGVGLHDSSSALIPYLVSFREPFALISSGTWCITLNPFNHQPLTAYELSQDCLCYLTYTGNPVKASRIFSGNDHEVQVKRLAVHFGCNETEYQQVVPDMGLVEELRSRGKPIQDEQRGLKTSLFGSRDLGAFENYAEAYHQLVMDLVDVQVVSSNLVLQGTPVKRIFVDGGFGRNELFMNLLAYAMPGYEIFAASVPQATALGAAMAIHRHWNSKATPSDLIGLKYFGSPRSRPVL
ncbi:MAG TPA: FGGY family carbohydrate kinase [Phnomibacter sp.]|nr:FGGY family carbohydrate kinase [Phnomibacter sp.]